MPIVANKTTDKMSRVVFTVRPRALHEEDGLYRGFRDVAKFFIGLTKGQGSGIGDAIGEISEPANPDSTPCHGF